MEKKERIRTIITQDAEIDDQNSLRHFLLYTNEVELQGIVQTSSIFHWRGVAGAVTPEKKKDEFLSFEPETGPYDQPFRWPGTDWMFRVADDYGSVYPNLKRQDERYPSPDEIRSLIKIGNIGYPGEMLTSTEGSDLIKDLALDLDPRKLYIQAWGGTNTIARALMDIQAAYGNSEVWKDLHEKLSDKIVITACGEQDNTYRDYIAKEWPDILFVHCMQMGSYAYAWDSMPEGESKQRLRASFMKSEIATGRGALMDGYALWADGKVYEGETIGNQFGSNPDLIENFWGKALGIGPYRPYDFISEGDSPTYFCLFDWGLRTLEDFSYGGFSGRYLPDPEEKNEKGQTLNYWKPQQDNYTDANGNTAPTESMWQYVADIQNDFAARAFWCVAKEGDVCEHAPALRVNEGTDFTVSAGTSVFLSAHAENPSGEGVEVTFSLYQDASTAQGALLQQLVENGVSVKVPKDAKSGEKVHVIVRAKNADGHQLTHYQQVIITVV